MPAQAQQVNCLEHQQVPGQVFDSDQPCVLRGLVSHWPVVEHAKESPQSLLSYLSELATAEPVTVYEVPASAKGRVFYNQDLSGFNFSRGKAPLAAVCDELQRRSSEDDVLYVGSTLLDHWLPEFRSANDIDLQGREALVSLWLGGPARIAAHHDFPHNIACNIGGRRRFTLFAPEQAKNLYIGPLDFTPAGQAISLVDFANPDLEKFPRFAEAQAASIVIELEPGDAIYIPSMWWHHVESLDQVNGLVNYWWRSTPVYHGSPSNALLHAILAIKDLPDSQRQIWQQMFDDYVFNADAESLEHIPEAARGILNPVDEESARALKQQLTRFLK